MTKPTAALLALLATILAPVAAHAQAGLELGSPTGATGTGHVVIPPPPQTVALDPELARLHAGAYLPPQADRAERSGPNLGASWGHAAGGFGLGLAGGALVGGVIAGAACGSDGLCPLIAFMGSTMGAGLVSPFGAALGAWGFGERSGGTGNFFAALGGAYLGAGLGIGVGALFGSIEGQFGLGAVLGPIVGALATTFFAAVGYQLSSRGTRAPTEPTNELVVAPHLTPTEGGATAGIAGMF